MRQKAALIILVAFLALVVGFGSVMTNSAYAADKVIKWRVQSHWPAASSSYKASLLVLGRHG